MLLRRNMGTYKENKMIHRDINEIGNLGNEIIYNDPISGEVLTGVVGRVEYLGPKVAFVYVISPYEERNNKIEAGFKYSDIIVFDDRPDTEHGWHKDPIKAYSKSAINR